MKWLSFLVIFLTMLTTTGCGSAHANSAAASDPASQTYTLTQVAEHTSETDCWMVISGGVYNVTSYIVKHPGGKRILEGCGKDATDLFTGKSVLGRVHSALARATLGSLKIGTVQ